MRKKIRASGWRALASKNCAMTGLASRLPTADLVVTGEGHLDPPSFDGKVPGGVLALTAGRCPVLCIVGDADAALPDEARARIVAFRNALARWESLERELDLPQLSRTILGETVLAVARDDARGRFACGLIARLQAQIEAFAMRRPLGTLSDFLEEAEAVAALDSDLLSVDERLPGCVRVLDVEAAKGCEFDHVFIVDVRAGAFPRYYVPDAFLFTPSFGMIPKENVGEGARSARTAKFTYALYRLGLRAKYNAEERRAFACAATRARTSLYVSASGRPTRGVAAPEILEELTQA